MSKPVQFRLLNCTGSGPEVRKGKAVPVHTMKVHGGSRGKTPLVLNLGTTGRWVINPLAPEFYI